MELVLYPEIMPQVLLSLCVEGASLPTSTAPQWLDKAAQEAEQARSWAWDDNEEGEDDYVPSMPTSRCPLAPGHCPPARPAVSACSVAGVAGQGP